jgi:hypothetical protein
LSSQAGKKGTIMVLSDRLRQLRKKAFTRRYREADGLAPLLYLARGKPLHSGNGRALEVPLYQLFYEGDEPPKVPNLLKRKTADDVVWGSFGKHAIYMHKLVKCLGKATDSDRKPLLSLTQKVAGRNRRVSNAV